MTSDLVKRVVRREPLATAGKSGSRLERGWLDDGSVVILKHSSVDEDWIMQATGDQDRIALLWNEGVFEHIPSVIQHAVLDVQRTDTGLSSSWRTFQHSSLQMDNKSDKNMTDSSAHSRRCTGPSWVDRCRLSVLSIVSTPFSLHKSAHTFRCHTRCRA